MMDSDWEPVGLKWRRVVTFTGSRPVSLAKMKEKVNNNNRMLYFTVKTKG